MPIFLFPATKIFYFLSFLVSLSALSFKIDIGLGDKYALFSNLSGIWEKSENESDIFDEEWIFMDDDDRGIDLYLRDSILCKSRTNLTKNRGTFRYFCGCFPQAGFYGLKIGNDTLPEEIDIKWPKIELFLPKKHIALTDSISVAVRRQNKLCKPEKPTFRTKLQILYRNFQNFYLSRQKFGVLHTVEVADLWTLNSDIILPCEYFDRAGLYKVKLVAAPYSQPGIREITESNEMETFWFSSYQIKMRTDGIFPCPDNGVAVSFSRPACEVPGDRIRLYAIKKQRGRTITKPMKLIYLSEQKIYPYRRKVVNFPCTNFDLIYPGYCFKYVTVLPDGMVKDNHTIQCVPTEPKNYELRDSDWSSWQEWGVCSVSCGAGVQHRIRICQQPEPIFRKGYCPGSALASRACNQHNCPNETKTLSELYFMSSVCRCGCNLTKSEETIAAYSNLCEKEEVTWLVRFEEQEARRNIVPEIRLLKVNLLAGDYLTIRDGVETSDALLFDSTVCREATGSVLKGRSKIGLRVDFRSGFSLVREKILLDRVYSGNVEPEWHGAVISFRLAELQQIDDVPIPVERFPFFRILIISACITGSLTATILLGIWFFWSTRRKMRENCRQLLASSYRTSDDGSSLPDTDCYTSIKRTARKIGGSPEKKNFPNLREKSLHKTPLTVEATVEKGSKREEEPLLLSPEDQITVTLDKQAPASKRMTLIGQGLSRLSENMAENMQTSTTTASTRLSGISQKSADSPPTLKPVLPPNIPKQRSIGIQLNSPALPLKTPSFGSRISMSTNQNGAATLSNRADSPSFSLAGTEQDFEYDYYEPNIPGSFLNPDWFRGGGFGELLSEIDIDEIIGDSELMNTPTRTPPGSGREKQVEGGEQGKGVSVSTQYFAPLPLPPVIPETLSFSGTTEGAETMLVDTTDGNENFVTSA